MAFAVAAFSLVPTQAQAAPMCFGREATIVGSNSHDGIERIVGTPGSDVIVGQGGTDIIQGRGGNDRICGGPGVDKIRGQGGRDRLSSGEEGCAEERIHEVLEGNGGADRLAGGPCLEKLYGGKGPDLITDPSSILDVDWLFGGPGDDDMSFGDALEEQFGGATFVGGPGNDMMRGDPDVRHTLDYSGSGGGVDVDLSIGRASGEGADLFENMNSVIGSSHRDVLRGDSGDNRLTGRGGDDSLFGSSGDDYLEGGRGADTADGGDGTDSCSEIEQEANCED